VDVAARRFDAGRLSVRLVPARQNAVVDRPGIAAQLR
jgi:hypothetical protein